MIDKVFMLDDLGLTSGELNMRYHEKLFIVDGEDPARGEAIIGGSNIANRYFSVQLEEPEFMWRDRDVLIKGSIVQAMTQSYDNTLREKKEKSESNLIQNTNLIWQFFSNVIKSKDPYDLSTRNATYISRLDAAVDRGVEGEWTDAKVRFIQSRPRQKEDFILPTYIKMIDESQESVKIVNSYFLPDNDFLIALVGAVQRGVDVTIITNHAKNTDFAQLQLLTRSYYKDLLKLNGQFPGSVKIFEWSGHEVLQNGEGQNHSKYAVFDDEVAIVGSYNLDPRSHKLNSESIVVIHDEEAIAPYVSEVDEFIGPEFSQEIALADALQIESEQSLMDRLELRILEIIKPLL